MHTHRTVTRIAAIAVAVAVVAPAASAQAATARHLTSHRKVHHAAPLGRARHISAVGRMHGYTKKGP